LLAEVQANYNRACPWKRQSQPGQSNHGKTRKNAYWSTGLRRPKNEPLSKERLKIETFKGRDSSLQQKAERGKYPPHFHLRVTLGSALCFARKKKLSKLKTKDSKSQRVSTKSRHLIGHA